MCQLWEQIEEEETKTNQIPFQSLYPAIFNFQLWKNHDQSNKLTQIHKTVLEKCISLLLVNQESLGVNVQWWHQLCQELIKMIQIHAQIPEGSIIQYGPGTLLCGMAIELFNSQENVEISGDRQISLEKQLSIDAKQMKIAAESPLFGILGDKLNRIVIASIDDVFVNRDKSWHDSFADVYREKCQTIQSTWQSVHVADPDPVVRNNWHTKSEFTSPMLAFQVLMIHNLQQDYKLTTSILGTLVYFLPAHMKQFCRLVKQEQERKRARLPVIVSIIDQHFVWTGEGDVVWCHTWNDAFVHWVVVTSNDDCYNDNNRTYVDRIKMWFCD